MLLAVAVGWTVAVGPLEVILTRVPWLGHVLLAVAVGPTVALGSREATFKIAPC